MRRTPSKPRIRFTVRELDTVLAVAGDALAEETLRYHHDDDADYQKDLAAFETGMEKLRVLLGRYRRD